MEQPTIYYLNWDEEDGNHGPVSDLFHRIPVESVLNKVGSVCEHLDQPELLTDVAFYGEENVESTMIDAVSERWHVTIGDFRSYEDLYKAIRAHLRAVA